MHFENIPQLIILYRYWILFPLAFFEGPLVSILVGFLVSLGYFNFLAAYGILILGDIIPDTLYYLVGRFGKRRSLVARYGKKIGLTSERFAVIERLWEKHPGKTMFMSKLAYGLSTPFLVSAGLVGLPPKLFFTYALPVTFAQYALLLTLGFYFGNAYAFIAKTFEGAELIIAASILAAGAYYFLTAYMRKRLLEEEKQEENTP